MRTHAGVAADPRQLPPEGCGPSVSVSDRWDISEDFYRQARARKQRSICANALRIQAGLGRTESDAACGLAERLAGRGSAVTGVDSIASDYASRGWHSLRRRVISGMVNNITEMLNRNKVEWRNWASSVLQEISKVLMNAAIVNGD